MGKSTPTVLAEEKTEAQEWMPAIVFGASITAFCGAVPVAIGLYYRHAAALPFVAVFWGATLLCLLALWRARRTIRRWRDQERERLALAEAERIGKEGVK